MLTVVLLVETVWAGCVMNAGVAGVCKGSTESVDDHPREESGPDSRRTGYAERPQSFITRPWLSHCPLAICQLVCQHMPPPDWLESALIRDGKLKEGDKVSCLLLVGSGKLFERTVYLQSSTSHSRLVLAIMILGVEQTLFYLS